MKIKKRLHNGMILFTCLILSILMLNVVLAEDAILSADEFPFSHKYVHINMDVKGNITLSGSISSISELQTKLSQYPRADDSVKMLFFNPNPDYEVVNDSIVFNHDIDNLESIESYVIHSGMNVYVNRKLIDIDPSFPLVSIPQEYSKYLQETEKIELTSPIKNKASEIVSESKGLFEASFRIAEWVYTNINYTAISETENNVKSSSWVYANRIGVCDEKTTLFLSMMRAVGVPARFVSGIAYTNELNLKDYGNHAWAEVYFPKYGWIPFDVTYGEFGWLDSTHIPLLKTDDSQTQSVGYIAQGNDVSIESSSVIFDTNTIDYGNYTFPRIDIDVEVLSNDVGFGSYNLIEATLTNKESGYMAIDVALASVPDLEIFGNLRKYVLIKPRESVIVYWVVKTSSELDNNSLYIFPSNVYSVSNVSGKTFFNVSKKGRMFSESYINNILRKYDESVSKEHSKFIEIYCDIPNYYILNEESELPCEISNNANIKMNNINVCFRDSCQIIDISDNSKENIVFKTFFNKLGLQTFILDILNDDVTKNEYLNFNVVDIPLLNITLDYPNSVEFNQEFSIVTNLKVKSISRPKNVKVLLHGQNFNETWEFDSLDVDQIINLKILGKHLFKDDNHFVLDVIWEDMIGREYNESYDITIDLVNLNLWQKFYAFVNEFVN